MKDLKISAIITHINPRKEGEDHDINAIDLKFQAKVPASVVDNWMCEGFNNDGDLIRALWLENETGDPRFLSLPGVGISRIFNNVRMTLMETIIVEGCKMQKISFAPNASHMANVEFTVTAKHLKEQEIAKIINVQFISILLELKMIQTDMFAEPEKAAGDGEQKTSA